MRRTPPAIRLLLTGVASACLAAGVAACSHGVAVGANRTVRIALSEYRVIPQSVRARPGQLVLVVENHGRLAHDLAVSAHGQILAQTPPLLPGAIAVLSLALRPGNYLLSSTLFSDQALGAYGTLNVSS